MNSSDKSCIVRSYCGSNGFFGSCWWRYMVLKGDSISIFLESGRSFHGFHHKFPGCTKTVLLCVIRAQERDTLDKFWILECAWNLALKAVCAAAFKVFA